MKNFALTILFFLLNFPLSSQHVGDFTITDGSLFMTNSSSTGLMNISGQVGRNLNLSSYRPVQNELITRMGINYAINGSNGQTQYAIIGSKKSPFIELNAENGSISLFGENGSGGNWRTSNSTSALGIVVDMNGMVGIGTPTPAVGAKLHIADGDLLLQNTSSGYPVLWLKDVSGSNTLRLDYNSLIGSGQNNVVIRSDNTKSVVLNDAGGNVGIGSTQPLAKLTVKQIGSGWNDGIRVERDASNYLTLTEDIDDIRLKNWGTGDISFYTSTVEGMRIMNDGKGGIGTTDPQSKLAVNGNIRATEVKVLADISVPDYVFESDYELRTLKETKEYIAKNKHLPEIPSAAEIEENGIDLGDMNMKLLKKIEELTLYQIELLERLEKAEGKISKLESK